MKYRRGILVLIAFTFLVGGMIALPAMSFAAAPEVVTVPWRGLLDLDHPTYNGKAIHLKGIARNVVAGATATWDPGDGSGPQAVGLSPGTDYDIQLIHTYPNSSPGTPFTAILEVCNNGAGAGTECASDTYRVVVRTRTLDVEINIAIDEGLWYLHRTQRRSAGSTQYCWNASPYTGYYAGSTASAVQAFQINNHFESNPFNQDPYAETVDNGLNCLFTRLTTDTRPGTQGTAWGGVGSADSNGNGIGVTATGGRPIYETGQVMDAIVTSKTPNAVTTTGQAPSGSNPGILGRTYADIIQDMVDQYAWGQDDTGSDRGGWRYSWNYDADNSACQWAAIGILAARDLFGATVPPQLYTENLMWMSASQTPAPPSNAVGYGYSGRGNGRATTPSGLVQLVMDGIQKTDAARWVGVEQTIANYWNSWYRDTNDVYALFALAKAMRLALLSPIVIAGTGLNAIDWYKADCANPAACTGSDRFGVARTLIRKQNADGMFTGSYRSSYWYRTAWSVIILTGTLQLEPVAVAAANPNPGADGVPVNFDGSGSFHTNPARSIVLYEWDFDNDNVTDATGVTASHAFNCPTLPTPCDFPVTLTVTDNSTPTPLVDTDTIIVTISIPPHPPTADADGPYMACTNEQVTLDGSGSFDIDEPLGDSITAYDWELDFVFPLDFADASGPTPTTSYSSAGLFDIGLQVTDDSSNVFGGPDLTDQDFTTITVRDCDCVDNFAARPKSEKIQLTWTPVAGAAGYDIYRSTVTPWGPFSLIAAGHVTSYATYLDTGLTNGVTYYYRIVPKEASGAEICGSDDVSATPQARRRR